MDDFATAWVRYYYPPYDVGSLSEYRYETGERLVNSREVRYVMGYTGAYNEGTVMWQTLDSVDGIYTHQLHVQITPELDELLVLEALIRSTNEKVILKNDRFEVTDDAGRKTYVSVDPDFELPIPAIHDLEDYATKLWIALNNHYGFINY